MAPPPPPLDLAALVAQVAQEKRLKKEEHELKLREQRHSLDSSSIPAPIHTPPPTLYAEPDSIPTTSTTSTPRPTNRRSRASFDWFGDSPRPASTTTSPQRGPLSSAGVTEAAEEADEFKGAFSTDDLERGARRMSESQGERPRAESLGAAEGGRRRASSVGRRGGKQKAREGVEEWEDELRDTMGEVGGPSGVSASVRKMSLWGAASRRSTRGASGSTTPEDSGEGEGGEGKVKRPKQIRRGTAGGWTALRQKLKGHGVVAEKISKTLTGHELINELATGVLPLVLIKMATMDRDERGEHRIPVLMNYLKLRITDSLYPFHDRHAVFRIELEYGDGLLKWVIYRELKDFVNLHAHFRVANFRQGIDKFPTFPKTSLPYLHWLKSEGRGSSGKAEFAKGQRNALEGYLLQLIRATMFGPGANRLCKFLEISAMSISLATRGGEQGKQGYLRIMSSGASRRKQNGFHPFSWKARHGPKWFVVRDSYILAVDDPASTNIYDVFMVDSTFEIERPTRVYRQGLHLFSHSEETDADPIDPSKPDSNADLPPEERPRGKRGVADPLDPSTTSDPDQLRDVSNHTFYLKGSERKLRLMAKTERQQDQFIASIERMVSKTIWAGKNRFDSFAPIRLNVAAQWLIDGRDYFWSLSRAILMAKEKIYIHDWWLSPQLYLRRPAAGNEKWRLDKLLQRKAREGVQIFVIVYQEVSNDFTPVDSNYTKNWLRALHPNIHVQRSPSHTSTGTLLWSHHEKMCVIDETIGFMGGLDLCFGRWDTPGHVLVDDGPDLVSEEQKHTIDENMRESSQIWPGKDYANPRVLDFHTLNKPEEDMYDRAKVPRQPWHDIGLQIIGQPARDLCRHFIQRWNFLLRTKNHTVEMPFLLPAPDFTAKQLQDKRITGTCEVQICRSVGPWSMGISHVEHSIQTAYIKAIQLSEHFVYIENQFFITSTEVENVVIENKIGDALVSRILRAHSEGTPWRAVIVIPLVPGYPFPIDHSDAGSVRLIMECQNRTICRGEYSIFARLRREGIDPDEYITFFGLRGWGKLSSGTLTTEAVYIHAKAMIVDDRTVIIGSANINERSQRGDRDSELACIIRDTDMIDSTMGGQSYQVGRFAHTMRIRLMREHLGVDVDELEMEDEDMVLLDRKPEVPQEMKDAWDPGKEQQEAGIEDVEKAGKPLEWASRAVESAKDKVANVLGEAKEATALELDKHGGDLPGGGAVDKAGTHTREGTGDEAESDGKFSALEVPTLEEKVMAEGRPRDEGQANGDNDRDRTPNQRERANGVAVTPVREDHSEDDESSGSATTDGKDARLTSNGDPSRPLDSITESADSKPPCLHESTSVSKDVDASTTLTPNGTARTAKLSLLSDSHESDLSRDLSRSSSPDSRGASTTFLKTSDTSAARSASNASLRRNLRGKASAYTMPVPPPVIDPFGFADPLCDSFYKDVWMAAAVRNTQAYRKVFRCVPDDLVQTWKQYREFQTWAERHNKSPKDVVPPGDEAPHSDPLHHSGQHGAGGGGSGGGAMGQGMNDAQPAESMRRRRASSFAGFRGNGNSERRGSNAAERRGSNANADRRGSNANTDRRTASSGTGAPAGETHDHEEGFPAREREQMEECLNEVRGHLVIYPTRFLEAESSGGNFLFSKDRLPPLSIYD